MAGLTIVPDARLDGRAIALVKTPGEKPSFLVVADGAPSLEEALRGFAPRDRDAVLREVRADMEAGRVLSGRRAKVAEALAAGAATKEVRLDKRRVFAPLPNTHPKKRDVYYITGPSGSGKSTFAAEYAKRYLKLYPDRKVNLISHVDEDPVLDDLGESLVRVDYMDLMKAQAEDPTIKWFDYFGPSIVIFDDVDAMPDKPIRDPATNKVVAPPMAQVVRNVMDALLTMGRHSNTTVLIATHHATNYSKTRLTFMETTHFVVFPESGTPSWKYMLKQYYGIEGKMLAVVSNMGRWVVLRATAPRVILGKKMAVLLR